MRKLILFIILASMCLGDTFTSHLKPNTDSNLDVGTSSLLWRYIYSDSITDGAASWISSNLSGFNSISGTTFTDGVFSVSNGIITGGTWQGEVITVPYGGTGAPTFIDGGILLGSGTDAITALGVATNGQIPIGDGTKDPVLDTITATANETDVTNGAGTITIGLPDDVIITGDLTISGDDLFMATNTDRFLLIGDGTNFNPEVLNLGADTTGNYVADVADGTGIDGTATGEGSTYTPTFDSTELDALTWSDNANASNIWTFDVSGTDHTMTAGNNLMTFSGYLTVTEEIKAEYITAVLGGSVSAYDVNNTKQFELFHDGTDSYISSKDGNLHLLLPDKAGVTKVAVLDSDGATVASIDSDGHIAGTDVDISAGTGAYSSSGSLGAGAITGTSFTDGDATLLGGNLTSMGNITGTDVDLSLGSGDVTTTTGDISGPNIICDTIILENSETITNAVDGTIRLEGVGGAYTKGFEIDLSSVSYGPVIKGTTSRDAGNRIYITGELDFLDSQKMQFGNSSDAILAWNISGNDHFMIKIRSGSGADGSGNFVIRDLITGPDSGWGDEGMPTLRIQALSATVGQCIKFQHDGTDGIIATEAGDLILTPAVNAGIGTTGPTAKLHVDQSSASGAMPVLRLDQADVDDNFIDFIGTSAADGSTSISSDVAENSAKFGAIRIEINGVTKWIRIYDDHN